MMPKISVIMPVYNGRRYLSEAVSSILNQTEADFEFVIVDDGSSDDSVKIIESFSDPRIRLIKKKHSGLIETLNIGIKESRGEYIARMDADDRALPLRLEKQLSRFEADKSLALCGSWSFLIDENGEKISEMRYPKISQTEIKKQALLHNPFIHSSVMIKKSILDQVGIYRSFWKHVEDYELWTRIIFKYETVNIPENLLEYRIHSNQITANKKRSMKLRGVLVRILALYRYLTA
jgi:glycosyltransferase involved in cell wall biosynthesis